MGTHRRLIVMFDGTWNEPEDWTNVARMKEAIDTGPVENGVEQEVKYFAGVGTNWFGKILGATMGFGLSEIIKDAYLWLSTRFNEGDEVFVFGFSRGAYSARSFVSLLHNCHGCLKKDVTTDRKVEEAYDLYRDAKVHVNDPKMLAFTSKYCRPVRVKMIGVWDTVGALGIPESAFQSKTIFKPLMHILSYTPINRSHYQFHGQGLPCIVDEAYHALAIDEHREDFAPTLWLNMKRQNKVLEQCWFVGSHSNVGGGVENDDLWQLSYEWMQNKAIALGLRYKWTYQAGDQWPHWRTDLESSFKNMAYGVYAMLNKEYKRTLGESVGEILHPSVVARIENSRGKYCPLGVKETGDFPENMHRELPYVQPPVVDCSCEQAPPLDNKKK